MVMWEWVVVGGRCRRPRGSEHDVLNGVERKLWIV